MEITSQSSAAFGAQNNAQQNQTSASTESATAISSDFETFLLMLTTQMENQDPLNPIESEDFAVQLATFSGVEQQVRTNQLLEGLAGGGGLTGMSGLAQLADWVGMEARVEAPVAFNGTPVQLSLQPAPGSDSAELVVLDAFGNEVGREAVPIGQDIIEWAGVGKNGQPLEPGSYTLQLASKSLGSVTDVSDVSHYTRITEARQGLDGIELVTEGGVVVPSDDVTALREPERDIL